VPWVQAPTFLAAFQTSADPPQKRGYNARIEPSLAPISAGREEPETWFHIEDNG